MTGFIKAQLHDLKIKYISNTHTHTTKQINKYTSVFIYASKFVPTVQKKKKATVKLLARLCTKPVNFTACYEAFSVKVQKTGTVCG